MKKILLVLVVALGAITPKIEAKESMTSLAARVMSVAVEHCKNMDKAQSGFSFL